MTMEAFDLSLADPAPPPGLPDHLLALWHDARGDWQTAHALVEEGLTPPACHVHAYLHRREGDMSNARYWYRRAGEVAADGPGETEYRALLARYLRPNQGDRGALPQS
ncbi:hypothetical protein HUK82_11030 [Ameyamaea chiangmaiensis]|uniref:Uncharacterized protein n=2 Tax=Ameyamaea chiangmaiensis TaxID=442969 RepID=A0A850PFS5_9PROT|nr:hypothetical protein [Ameyamaea chiangmaiensis]